ncbi:MAG: acyltransferase family protein [Nocardioides sp.]
MPRPTGDDARYVPALDGIRALAVLAVLGYHLALPGLGGGLLGVGVFFTLSGYLITGILVESWEETGSFRLRRFWLARARRLLPALVLVLATVLTVTALADRRDLADRWGDTWSAALYVANWHTIVHGQSYFERFAGPGPLDHLWSLSVEEQFYVVWPLVLVVAMRLLRRGRRPVFRFTALLTVVSFALLAMLATPGLDNTRAYEGTDTRAGGILVGALLALAWPRLQRTTWPRLTSFALQLGAVAGLGGIGWLVAQTDDYSHATYTYGLLLLSLASAALIAGAAWPRSVVGRLLGLAPLRWVGERSYGLYLWQLPVIASVPVATVAAHRWVWSAGLTAVTVVLAELSWRWVEDPIRRLGLLAALREVRRPHLTALPVRAVALAAVGILALASARLAERGPTSDDDPEALLSAQSFSSTTTVTAPARPRPAHPGSTHSRRAHHTARHHTGRHHTSHHSQRTHHVATHGPQTSCRSDAHIGESTSLGLVSPSYLPNPRTRLPAQLERVGVRTVRTNILGARSIVERWHDQPNAQDAVEGIRASGYHGCWTIAMGTNDAANQAVGGVYTYAQRIDLLMHRIGNQPVLWLTVKSLRSSGPYADANMQRFDDALQAACARYPNLRIYDWRSEVRSSWFISDGIHFTSAGYAERARRIADALALAFPAQGGASTSCVVGSGLS